MQEALASAAPRAGAAPSPTPTSARRRISSKLQHQCRQVRRRLSLSRFASSGHCDDCALRRRVHSTSQAPADTPQCAKALALQERLDDLEKRVVLMCDVVDHMQYLCRVAHRDNLAGQAKVLSVVSLLEHALPAAVAESVASGSVAPEASSEYDRIGGIEHSVGLLVGRVSEIARASRYAEKVAECVQNNFEKSAVRRGTRCNQVVEWCRGELHCYSCRGSAAPRFAHRLRHCAE